MKKNNIAQTRIQRYSKLREKIDQEIRDLKLKNENDARLNYFLVFIPSFRLEKKAKTKSYKSKKTKLKNELRQLKLSKKKVIKKNY